MNTVEIIANETIGTINPSIYGHIGGVTYDGIWVGKESPVETVRCFAKLSSTPSASSGACDPMAGWLLCGDISLARSHWSAGPAADDGGPVVRRGIHLNLPLSLSCQQDRLQHRARQCERGVGCPPGRRRARAMIGVARRRLTAYSDFVAERRNVDLEPQSDHFAHIPGEIRRASTNMV